MADIRYKVVGKMGSRWRSIFSYPTRKECEQYVKWMQQNMVEYIPLEVWSVERYDRYEKTRKMFGATSVGLGLEEKFGEGVYGS